MTSPFSEWFQGVFSDKRMFERASQLIYELRRQGVVAHYDGYQKPSIDELGKHFKWDLMRDGIRVPLYIYAVDDSWPNLMNTVKSVLDNLANPEVVRISVNTFLVATYTRDEPYHPKRADDTAYKLPKELMKAMQEEHEEARANKSEFNNDILVERKSVYGDPVEMHNRIAKIWSAILKHDVSAHDVALCMVGLKLARAQNAPSHKDSLVDAAGYTEIAQLIAEREEM